MPGRTRRPGLINESLGDLQAQTVTLHADAEALRSADVDVVLRQIHSVASFVRAQRLDGGEDRGHSRLVLDLLEQALADQKRLDSFLNDGGHRAGNHEGRVLDVQRVLDRDELAALVRHGRAGIVRSVVESRSMVDIELFWNMII